nr:hypothetical protein [Tanacetum cinerariifolium]
AGKAVDAFHQEHVTAACILEQPDQLRSMGMGTTHIFHVARRYRIAVALGKLLKVVAGLSLRVVPGVNRENG